MRAALVRRMARRLASATCEPEAGCSAVWGPLQSCGAQPLAQTPSPAPAIFCHMQWGAGTAHPASSGTCHGIQHCRQPAGWGTNPPPCGAAAARLDERALTSPRAALASSSAARCSEDWRVLVQHSSEPGQPAGAQQQPVASWPSSSLLAGQQAWAFRRAAEAQAAPVSGLRGLRCRSSAPACALGARCSSAASSSESATVAAASRRGGSVSSGDAGGSGCQGQAASVRNAQPSSAAGESSRSGHPGAGGPAAAQTAAQVEPLPSRPLQSTAHVCMDSVNLPTLLWVACARLILLNMRRTKALAQATRWCNACSSAGGQAHAACMPATSLHMQPHVTPGNHTCSACVLFELGLRHAGRGAGGAHRVAEPAQRHLGRARAQRARQGPAGHVRTVCCLRSCSFRTCYSPPRQVLQLG